MDWLNRLKAEYAELTERLIKLEQFLIGNALHLEAHVQADLHEQVIHMRGYHQVLFRRIVRAGG